MIVEYANSIVQSTEHSVTLYTCKVDTVFLIDPRIKLVMIAQSLPVFLLKALFLKFPHDAVIVDIIHLPLLLLPRNKVVYFAQADDVEYYGGFAGRLMMDWLYRLYLKRGRRVITVSQELTDRFRKRYGFNDAITVTNGIDLETFYPDPDKELLRIKQGRKAILLLARGDIYRKGFDIAEQVLAIAGRDHIASQIEVWVCGRSLPTESFDLIIRNFGIVDDVRLRQILSSADILFYPSRHEGFGLFPLEAMACGCAVVTTTAVPYAESEEAIQTSPIGNIDKLFGLIKQMVINEMFLADIKVRGKLVAATYDIADSKRHFHEALLLLSKGGK